MISQKRSTRGSRPEDDNRIRAIYFNAAGERCSVSEFTKPVPVEVTVREMTSYLEKLSSWMRATEEATA